MLSEKRQEEILRLVNEEKSVTVQELKEYFDASESTIRRDITALAKEGKLVKVFGGALALESSFTTNELTNSQKEQINREEKERIAKYAAELISPGDYVFIDSGTTTGMMVDYITEKDATYVTNAVVHAKKLTMKGLRVLLIGGELKETTEAVIGADAVLHIQKYHFSKGFFGTNGISIKSHYTTPDVREALVKRVAVENTLPGKRYILADHDKFGQVSSVTFADLDGTIIITDQKPESLYIERVDVVIANKSK
ncbi:MAG: DeoR/GlpR transcriptional regulator [Eubacterium sp.]|nr:DeoR/GlpR transcriptional regulator [Eubacterium sp.]